MLFKEDRNRNSIQWYSIHFLRFLFRFFRFFFHSKEWKDHGNADIIIVTSFKLLFYQIRKRIRNDFSHLMRLIRASANGPFKARSPNATWRINKFEIQLHQTLLSSIIHLNEKQIILDRAAAIDFRKSALRISVTLLHRYFVSVDRIIRFARDKFEDIIPHETKINEV